MDAEGFYGDLRSAVALAGERAVLRVKATYQPAGGLGSKVFPPTYPSQDGRPYVIESRMVGGEKREDVLLDSVPSQANPDHPGAIGQSAVPGGRRHQL
jgi:CRISPR-associated protein Csb1